MKLCWFFLVFLSVSVQREIHEHKCFYLKFYSVTFGNKIHIAMLKEIIRDLQCTKAAQLLGTKQNYIQKFFRCSCFSKAS